MNYNSIAEEMNSMMSEIAAQWEADDKERARRYRIASIFLSERMLDDLERVLTKTNIKEAVGSYAIHQRLKANESLSARIADIKNLILFLKKAENSYFIGDKNHTNREAEQLLRMLSDYFRGDCSNLKLAKISTDIEHFRMCDSTKGIGDIIIISLENSIDGIFKE